MQLLGDLAAFSILALGLLLLLIQLAAREAGYWYGKRRLIQNEKKDEGVNVVVGAILGLLAFVLALNLSIATTRNAERRLTSLEEANAISTAWLQASAISDPRGAAIALLLQDYTAARLDFISADRGSPAIADSIARTSALQTEIWGHMTALLQVRPDLQSTALMSALNTTFDMSTAVRFALAYTAPPQLLWLLLILNVIGMAALGYQFGLVGRHHRFLATVMNILLTVILVEIVDIGNSRIGDFRGDRLAYAWTVDGFKPIPIPNLPN